MRINRALNLVIPLETEAGTAYVHATPIAREVFERYYLVMGKAFTKLYSEGLGALAGPRVAYLMLKEIATEAGAWSGPEGIENALVGEIVRLSNIALPGASGWEQIGLSDAKKRGLLDDDEFGEVLGQLVFFTLEARLHRRDQAMQMLALATGLWGSRITSSPFTDFLTSLPTSTPAASSGTVENAGMPEPTPPAAQASTSFPLR